MKSTGSIVAWGGENLFGQNNVPAPNAGFIAVGGGTYHSVGLMADGSIVAWGAGPCGQFGGNEVGQSCVPQPNSDFIAISVGAFHNLAIKDVRPKCATADLNCDGVVNVDDLLIILNNWGQCADCNDCIADVTGDCEVNVDDLLMVLNNWG